MYATATATPILSTERHEQYGTDWVNGQRTTAPVGVDEVHWAECPVHGERVQWHSVTPLSTLDFCEQCVASKRKALAPGSERSRLDVEWEATVERERSL